MSRLKSPSKRESLCELCANGDPRNAPNEPNGSNFEKLPFLGGCVAAGGRGCNRSKKEPID